MPFCTKCGTQVPETSNFCKKCGKAVPPRAQSLERAGVAGMDNATSAESDVSASVTAIDMSGGDNITPIADNSELSVVAVSTPDNGVGIDADTSTNADNVNNANTPTVTLPAEKSAVSRKWVIPVVAGLGILILTAIIIAIIIAVFSNLQEPKATSLLPLDIKKVPFGANVGMVIRKYKLKNLTVDVRTREQANNYGNFVNGTSEELANRGITLYRTKEFGFDGVVSFYFHDNKLYEVDIAYDTFKDINKLNTFYEALKEEISFFCAQRLVQSTWFQMGCCNTMTNNVWNYSRKMAVGLFFDPLDEIISIKYVDHTSGAIKSPTASMAGYDKVLWGASIEEVKQSYGQLEESTSPEDSLINVRIFSLRTTEYTDQSHYFNFYFYQDKLYEVMESWQGPTSGAYGHSWQNPNIVPQVETARLRSKTPSGKNATRAERWEKRKPRSAKDFIDRGILFAHREDFKAAIEDFAKAQKLKPKMAEAYTLRGRALVASSAQKVIFRDDDFDRIVVRWSKLTNEQKRICEQAIADFTQAIKLDPQNPINYRERGRAYSLQEDYNKSIADYDRAIQLIPNDAIIYNLRGIVYANKDNDDKAITDYDKAILLDSNLVEAYYNRGNAYSRKGDLDKAIADYGRTILLNSDNAASSYSSRGIMYIRKGEFDKATADLDQAMRLDSNHATPYNGYGIMHNRKGEFDKAIESFSRAIQKDPQFINAYINRGDAYSSKGDFERAISDYGYAIRLDPNNYRTYYNRGVAYLKKGNNNQAITDFEQVIRLIPTPNSANAYFDRGTAYSETGNYERAIQDFNQTIRLDSNFAVAYNNRGHAYISMDNFDRAIVDFDRAIKLNSNDANAYNNRGYAYLKKGFYSRAIADYEKTLKINRNYESAKLNIEFARQYHKRSGDRRAGPGYIDHRIVVDEEHVWGIYSMRTLYSLILLPNGHFTLTESYGYGRDCEDEDDFECGIRVTENTGTWHTERDSITMVYAKKGDLGGFTTTESYTIDTNNETLQIGDRKYLIIKNTNTIGMVLDLLKR